MPLEVLPVEPQPDWIRPCKCKDGAWHGYCSSGPDEGVIAPHSPGDTREASGERQVCVSVECRKVDSISEEEAEEAGFERDFRADGSDYGAGLFNADEEFRTWWEATHPAYPWGSWAWFVKWEAVKEESDASNHPAADTV